MVLKANESRVLLSVGKGQPDPWLEKKKKKKNTTVFLNGEGHSRPTEPLSCVTRDFEVGLNIALHLLWYLWYIWLFALCPCQLIIFPFPVSDKITSYRAWNTPLPPRDLMLHEKHCDVSRYRVVSGYFSTALCFIFGSSKGGLRKFVMPHTLGTMDFQLKCLKNVLWRRGRIELWTNVYGFQAFCSLCVVSKCRDINNVTMFK